MVEAQRLELHHRVQAVAELRGEALADHFHRIGGMVLLGETNRTARRMGGAGIGGHHQHHVLEVGLAPVGVGEDAAVHDLQQDVEDVRMRFLHLVQQQHAMRGLDDLFGQQATLVETDIARRGTDQTADRMRLHVLGHVETDQLDAQLQRKLAGDLGLADAGGAGKQEVADRLFRVAQARARQLDGRGQRFNRRVLAEDHHLQVALQVLEHVLVGGSDLLGRDTRHLGDDRLDLLDIDALLALTFRQQALAGTRLVDHVDRLVRQQAVADVLDRQVHRRAQRVIRIGHAVVRLVLGAQALEDFIGLAHGRLDDVDLLEAAGQRTVLLEDAAVLLERGRADAAQLTGGQRRLDQVGSVHGATRRRTGANDGVDLIDEEHRIGDLLQRGDHPLQALLEVAAILGPGHQRTQVQRIDHRIGQHLGHFAVDDALGQAFGDGGLAHAGLAHVQRVVLATAAQHLDGAFDLIATPHQRIDAAGLGGLVEVAGKFGQGVALGLALAPFRTPLAIQRRRHVGVVTALGHAMGQVIDHVQPGHILLVEVIDRVRFLLAEDRHQHVGTGDLLLARGLHMVDGPLQHPLEAQGGLGIAAIVFGQQRDRGIDGLLQLATQALQVGTTGLEHRLGRGVLQQCQQQMFNRHVFMTGLSGALVALTNGLLEVFTEHGGTPIPVGDNMRPCCAFSSTLATRM